MKIGEFLVKRGIISQEQLEAALSLQKDNPAVLLGDIFITQGVLDRPALMDGIEDYIKETGIRITTENEWLSQTEIDEILSRIQ